MNDELYISIAKAAKMTDRSVQALYQAAGRGVLRTKKMYGRIMTKLAWLKEYDEHLYSRDEHATFNGKRTFNPSKGEYSIEQAAKLLGVNPAQLYWKMKMGKLRGIRRGAFWVIPQDQLQVAQEAFVEKTA